MVFLSQAANALFFSNAQNELTGFEYTVTAGEAIQLFLKAFLSYQHVSFLSTVA